MFKKLFFIFAIFLLTCCNSNRSPIPDVPVRLEFSIIADAPELINFNGFKEFTVPQNALQYLGYGGILVFHTMEDKYCAFDMSCPFEAKPDVRVHCDNTGIARCDSCQSAFYVGDGTAFPINANSKTKFPLKRYSVYNPSMFNIVVTN